MRVTIDKAGRIVVPKPLRDQLALEAGAELEARVEGGALVAVPVGPTVELVEEEGRLVAAATGPTPELSQDELLRLIDDDRQWPHPR